MTPWTKPDFEEITLNMEVTAYVNTDRELPSPGATEFDRVEEERLDARFCPTG
jgi:coenzyme PQQ precursor peptide PqqA